MCPTGTAHSVQNLLSKSVIHCFNEDIKNKLEKVNSVSVSCDGCTYSAVIEKGCVYILFVDSKNFAPQISFLSLKDVPSPYSHSIKLALLEDLQDTDMIELKNKIVFLACNGTSLSTKFEED